MLLANFSILKSKKLIQVSSSNGRFSFFILRGSSADSFSKKKNMAMVKKHYF